ncbi:MAG: endonuclease III, partial [Clostridia bacterium]|nr:endonuclease III [Clostridia bacterium]
AIVEPAEQAPLCHRFVHFGRDICTARSPQCHRCPLRELCKQVNTES